jgi:Holliday junction DNA helicase RuvB
MTKNNDEVLLASLRANKWNDFCGQEKIKDSLLIGIKAAKQRKEQIDHVLFYGPAGLGKTTLCHLVAIEMGVNLKITSGTALTKVGDLAAILTSLEEKDVLFIDEIHRLNKSVEETLYPAMEDFALDLVVGKGPSAKTLRIDLPKFTLIGATTRFGNLTAPFRDRFGSIFRLQFYSNQALVNILQKASKKLNIELDDKSAHEIARRSRGTPRISLKLLKRVRDFAQVKFNNKISPNKISETLNLLQVDSLGLSDHDRKFLESLITKHQGGPVGLSTICATLNEDPLTIEEVIEPYLIQIGFLKKTPKGRVISKKAYQHLNLENLYKERE